MNENELKNYLAAQEIITDNVLDKHVYKIAKNEEGDITSDDLEINNDKLEIFINFAFEKYFLKKRNIRGAENINRQEITNYINFEDETATHLNNLAINLKDGFANTLRRNQELVLVILLFEIGENKGLLFLTFAPEEYMGIIDGEIFYENFKNIFEENENILTKDFPIKIVKTYEKVTLKINNQSNVVIKAFEEEIAKFRISEDGTELIMQIDNINADRVNEIRGKYSSQ